VTPFILDQLLALCHQCARVFDIGHRTVLSRQARQTRGWTSECIPRLRLPIRPAPRWMPIRARVQLVDENGIFVPAVPEVAPAGMVRLTLCPPSRNCAATASGRIPLPTAIVDRKSSCSKQPTASSSAARAPSGSAQRGTRVFGVDRAECGISAPDRGRMAESSRTALSTASPIARRRGHRHRRLLDLGQLFGADHNVRAVAISFWFQSSSVPNPSMNSPSTDEVWHRFPVSFRAATKGRRVVP